MIKRVKDEYKVLCQDMLEIAEAKNSDYANDQDIWANFRLCEMMGVPAWKGALVRLGDKLSRMSSFQRKGTFAVADEGFKDTCIDAANYSMITMGLYEEDAEIPRAIKSTMSDLIGDSMSGLNNEPEEFMLLASGKGKETWDYILDETTGLYRILARKIKNDKLEPSDIEQFLKEIAVNSILAYCFWKEETKDKSPEAIRVPGPWKTTITEIK